MQCRFVFDKEIIVEIKAGEGGDDSKNFVHQLFDVYVLYAKRLGFKHELLDSDDGNVVVKFEGIGIAKAFRNESGKHVVQRIPITEMKGRKQTSIISVTVLPLPPEKQLQPLRLQDLEITVQTGKQKAGGQNVNRVHSAVRMKHKPTGLTVFIQGRDQGQNKKEALHILTAKVNQMMNDKVLAQYQNERLQKMRGNSNIGGRGEKIRTYNFMESRVVDHRLGVKTSNIKEIFKGHLELLF